MTPDSTIVSTPQTPDTSQQNRLGRHDAYVLLVLLGIIAAALGIRWYYDNWIVDYDLLTQYMPWYGSVGEAVREFRVPAWNPSDSSGTPLAGSPASGWMNLALMAVFAAFSVITAVKVYALTLAIIAGVSTYLLCRKLGLGAPASLTGATALAIGPMMYGSTMFGLWNSQVTAFIPLGVLAVEGAIRSPRVANALGWSALAGLALSQMYLGSPPRFMYGAMYVFGWLAYRWLFDNREIDGPRGFRFVRLVIVAAAMSLIAAGFSAAAVLPQLDFLAASNISGVDYSNLVGGDYAAAPYSWSEILRHYFSGTQFRNDRTLLLGAGLVLLVLNALVFGRRRIGLPFFGLLVLVFVDLTASVSLTRWLFYLVPTFEDINSHRQSASDAMSFFAIAMLAAIGVQASRDAWMSPASKQRLLAFLPALLFGGIVLLCGVTGTWVGWPQLIVGLLASLALVLPRFVKPGTLADRRLMSNLVVGTFLVLIFAFPTGADFVEALRNPSGAPDYAVTIAKDTWVGETAEKAMRTSDPGSAADLLQYQQSISYPFRYAPFTGTAESDQEAFVSAAEQRNDPAIIAILANGRATRLGLEQIPGYNPTHLNHYVEYIDAMNGSRQDYHYLDVMTPAIDGSQLFNMLNVRFVLVPADLGYTPAIALTGVEVYRDSLVIVYENPSYFQRAWIVHDVQPNNDGEGLAQLAAGTADGRVTAFVDTDGPLPDVLPVAAGADLDWLVFEDRSDEMLRFRTGTSQPGLAVISQSYDEGWVAYVDGQKTDVIRTNHALMGVPVFVGEHQIELRYEPESLSTGLWITTGTTAVIFGLWLFPLYARFGASIRKRLRRGTTSAVALYKTHPTIVTLAVHMVIVFALVAFRWRYDNWLADFDRSSQFLPWFSYIGERLRDFQIPAWNPHDSSGTPLAAAPASGWMYFPVMIAFTLFDAANGYKFMVLLQSLVGGISMFALCRRLGMGHLASFAASTAFATGPLLYGATLNGTPSSQVIPFLPLAILAAENALRTATRSAQLGWAMLGAVALINMFTGSPPRFMFGALTVAAWLGYRWLISRPEPVESRRVVFSRALIFGIASGIATAALGLIVIWPQFQFQAASNVAGADYSNVVGGDYVQTLWSWRYLLRTYLESDALRTRGIMMNVVVWILAFVALFLGRNRFQIWFWAGLTWVYMDLTWSLSLSRHVLNLIPGFEHINSHRPNSSGLFAMFSVAMLMGAGVQTLLNVRPERRTIILKCLPLALFLLLYIEMQRSGNHLGTWTLVIALLGTVALLLPDLMRFFYPKRPQLLPIRISIVSVIVLSFVYPTGTDFVEALTDPTDSPLWNKPIALDEPVSRTIDTMVSTEPTDPSAVFMTSLYFDQNLFRYAPYTGSAEPDGVYLSAAARRMEPQIIASLANARAMFLGLEQIPGYNPIHLDYYVNYVDVMNGAPQDYHYLDMMEPSISGSQLFNMLNTRYILVPSNLQPQPTSLLTAPVAYSDELVIIYENPNAFPRAWIVHDVQPGMDGQELELLNTYQVDGRSTAFVEGDLPPVSIPADGANSDLVTINRHEPEYISVNATTGGDGLLVFSEIYADGWNAYVDGEKVSVVRTNHALRGVPVTAGEHTVELKYEPIELRIGLWSTALASVGIVAIWIWAGIEHYRKRPEIIESTDDHSPEDTSDSSP